MADQTEEAFYFRPHSRLGTVESANPSTEKGQLLSGRAELLLQGPWVSTHFAAHKFLSNSVVTLALARVSMSYERAEQTESREGRDRVMAELESELVWKSWCFLL
jgi:hypothetical protein